MTLTINRRQRTANKVESTALDKRLKFNSQNYGLRKKKEMKRKGIEIIERKKGVNKLAIDEEISLP